MPRPSKGWPDSWRMSVAMHAAKALILTELRNNSPPSLGTSERHRIAPGAIFATVFRWLKALALNTSVDTNGRRIVGCSKAYRFVSSLPTVAILRRSKIRSRFTIFICAAECCERLKRARTNATAELALSRSTDRLIPKGHPRRGCPLFMRLIFKH